MSQYFSVHPETPQPRLIRRTVEVLQRGGVIVYPTDSTYALGCVMGEKAAIDRIRQIRALREDHDFTLACRDLSDIGTYARLENNAFRLLKAHTPGPYTFILKATGEVPRRLQHPKRKTIGIRVPGNPVAQALLAELGEPLMTTSLLLPGDDMAMTDAELIRERIGRQVDAVLDGGSGGLEPSTVIDLSEPAPRILRRGQGDPTAFET
ncbi:L-threonylcarbamoyladenylate synthase [Sediminicurvatus halobius]|uniref:Threonylcarbamoyl-AMP synthase n=1 Tax=Sediminicurvatus halobius TaxID=2182432 RepID=A0A2U2N3E0_9GAMM|nr:L-threonylcarbamoyladenylate synthase [Spiribacter halobius]PWG63494.1 threonylcarbamoyl-AMP synthase [Spiribacter halobius]UEX79635.1 threonylcarbamoyl-AMP synthase [Spiribacter halobius]